MPTRKMEINEKKKIQNFHLFFTPKLKWGKATAYIWLSLFHFSKNHQLISSQKWTIM